MKFTVERNDIAKVEADAVVLPANWRLRIGTGASMALFEAAGQEQLEAECALQYAEHQDAHHRLVPGWVIPTHAFDLPAQVILHTIVPKWRPNEQQRCYEELCLAYAAALKMADEMGMKSIAFPLLAAGNNGFDKDLALTIALSALETYEPKGQLEQAYLITFDADITQKVRDRGIEVKEHIDQTHVLEQTMHQAQWWQEEKRRRRREKERNQPAMQTAIDKGIRWIKNPKNQQTVFAIALAIAEVALPTTGPAAKARKVLVVVKPFLPAAK